MQVYVLFGKRINGDIDCLGIFSTLRLACIASNTIDYLVFDHYYVETHRLDK